MSVTVETVHGGITTADMGLPWFRIREGGDLRWEAWRNLDSGGLDVWDVAVRPPQFLPQGHPDHDRIISICTETSND